MLKGSIILRLLQELPAWIKTAARSDQGLGKRHHFGMGPQLEAFDNKDTIRLGILT
jgi:hypothetical protein